MTKAQELRRRAADLATKIATTVEDAEKQNREITEAEQTTIAEWQTEAESLVRRAKVNEAADSALEATRGPVEARASQPLSGNQGGPSGGSGLDIGNGPPQGVRGQSEGDKTRFFGDMLRNILVLHDKNKDPKETALARERIHNVYQSEYRDWQSSEKRTLTATTGSAGGFLIPPDFQKSIMQVVGEDALVRPRATSIPITGLSIDIPLLNQTSAPPTGGSAFFGGINMQWTGETEAKPSTEPGVKMAKLELHELSGTTPVSNVLLRKSAISIDSLLFTIFGRATAWMEDQAFLMGNTASRPKGVLTSGALVQTADRGSSTAISFANIANCWVKALASSQGKGIFIASQAAQPAVLAATGTAGSTFIPAGLVPITPDGVKAAGYGIGAFGRPILFSEKLPALDTLGDFGFYDFSQYIIGDSDMGMEIAVSDQFLFSTNQTMFRIIHYVGGMPWMDAPITLADGSTQVSPFVALAIH
jgi:HK97 family phage major capsid protein